MDGQHDTSDSSSSPPSFLLIASVVIFLLIVVAGSVLMAAYLVAQPPLPIFQLTSLSLTNISSSTTQSHTATCHLSFLSRNRQEKVTTTFKPVQSTISYRGITLADASLAPFKLDGAKSETAINATVIVAGTFAVQAGWRGTVNLDVQLEASGSSRYGRWRFRGRSFRVSCRQVPVGMSPDATSGALVGGTRECDVCTRCLDSKGWDF